MLGHKSDIFIYRLEWPDAGWEKPPPVSWEGIASLTVLTERDLPKNETKHTSFDHNPWGKTESSPPISFASCGFAPSCSKIREFDGGLTGSDFLCRVKQTPRLGKSSPTSPVPQHCPCAATQSKTNHGTQTSVTALGLQVLLHQEASFGSPVIKQFPVCRCFGVEIK